MASQKLVNYETTTEPTPIRNASTAERRTRHFERSGRTRSLFPLTPALSLRERELPSQPHNISRRASLAETLAAILPLPRGEGRGEGECNVRAAAAAEASKLSCHHFSIGCRPAGLPVHQPLRPIRQGRPFQPAVGARRGGL